MLRDRPLYVRVSERTLALIDRLVVEQGLSRSQVVDSWGRFFYGPKS